MVGLPFASSYSDASLGLREGNQGVAVTLGRLTFFTGMKRIIAKPANSAPSSALTASLCWPRKGEAFQRPWLRANLGISTVTYKSFQCACHFVKFSLKSFEGWKGQEK